MATETWPPGQTVGSHTYATAGTYTITATQPGGEFDASAPVSPAPVVYYTGFYTGDPETGQYTWFDPATQITQWDTVAGVISTQELPHGSIGQVELAAYAATVGDFYANGKLLTIGGQPAPLQMYMDMGYENYPIGMLGPDPGSNATAVLYDGEDIQSAQVVWEVDQAFNWGTLNVVQTAASTPPAQVALILLYGSAHVEWGDGASEDFTSSSANNAVYHTYTSGATGADYTVTVTPTDTSYAAFSAAIPVPPENLAPYGYPMTPNPAPIGTLPIDFEVVTTAAWPADNITAEDTANTPGMTVTRTGTGVTVHVTSWNQSTGSFIFWPMLRGKISKQIGCAGYAQQVMVQ